jgi:hypothetical protein
MQPILLSWSEDREQVSHIWLATISMVCRGAIELPNGTFREIPGAVALDFKVWPMGTNNPNPRKKGAKPRKQANQTQQTK